VRTGSSYFARIQCPAVCVQYCIPVTRVHCRTSFSVDLVLYIVKVKSFFLFLGGITVAQAIPPIATHFAIARSVCRLSSVTFISCTLLKPFDGFTCRFAGTFVYLWYLWGLVTDCHDCVRWGSVGGLVV